MLLIQTGSKKPARSSIYEGHDVPASSIHPNPKLVDQPLFSRSGKPTPNGLFFKAAGAYKASEGAPELVKVYEKITRGIWVYCGVFELVGAWQEQSNARQVFKFKLRLRDDSAVCLDQGDKDVEHNRLIPTAVKLEVWKRDKGKCVKCGSRDNLHFDHVIPYSKGGSSLVSDNIQILCARHNLEKKDRIE